MLDEIIQCALTRIALAQGEDMFKHFKQELQQVERATEVKALVEAASTADDIGDRDARGGKTNAGERSGSYRMQ
jgi:hypothetical protein